MGKLYRPAGVCGVCCYEPLFSRTFAGTGRTPSKDEVKDSVAEEVRREAGPEPGNVA
jgi:hypothetical protein